jgi:5-methylcytosine-specific restriction endonuclease McrA
VCGRPIGQRRRSYCTYACQVRACGARVCDLYRLASEKGFKGAGWRHLLVGYLRERDGANCQICRKPIRYDLRSGVHGDPSGLGPSIDHVVPRSEGGDDDLANLRLAHWCCNRARQAGGGNEQLLLIG